MSVLAVEDLHVWFDLPGGRELHAVQGVSFALDAGERLGLVGESGCGKTTAILAMMGLLPPSASAAGRILLDGEDILAGGDGMTGLELWYARGAGATFGDFVISGSILLDANGADAASLTYWGDDVRLNTGRITIDTLQSATGPGGDVLLGAGDSTARAELTGMTSDVSLLVDTRGTTANGQVALGSVTNGGGGPDRFYLGSIGVTSSSSATAGGVFLNGSTIQTDGVALFGAATRDAEVWLSGAITAAGNLTIDTQASSGTAGDVVLALPGRFHRAGWAPGQMDTRLAFNRSPTMQHNYAEDANGTQ